ncbi:MAG: ABC transporter ATP-binding protein [Gemmatimonadetes bacterium]|nr:ABC transporter ATP-binding protein [Gemmatimonadota bacterium]
MDQAVIVSARAVGKRYRRDGTAFDALQDVSFSIAPGTFGVLVGRSGSGKTTLLNIIGGLDRPTSGALHAAGRDLAGLSDGELSRYRNEKVGFVFQAFNLANEDSALENVLTPYLFARGRHRDAVERGRASLASVGLSDLADQKAGTLSAGQRQRVAIARAIVRDPVLLLADEPTGNLDAETGSEVIGLLKHLNHEQHMTVIVATHDPELTEAAGFILTLRDGRVAADEAEP